MIKEVDIRLRLVICKEEDLLLTYNSLEDYYYYVGGKLEYGETIKEGSKREIREECGDDTEFEMEKVLYIRDYIDSTQATHCVDLFILGDINKKDELEGKTDPEHKERSLTWRNIYHLPINLYPTQLSDRLVQDYSQDFPNQGEYLGNIP